MTSPINANQGGINTAKTSNNLTHLPNYPHQPRRINTYQGRFSATKAFPNTPTRLPTYPHQPTSPINTCQGTLSANKTSHNIPNHLPSLKGFQESFKGVSRKIEGCFNGVLSGFQGCLKEVQWVCE